MGVKLRDVPPSGLTFSTDEYNRHKAIYSPSMKFRRSGPNFIEDGILYAHVRVCLIQEGDDPATCEGTTRDVTRRMSLEIEPKRELGRVRRTRRPGPISRR